MPLMTLNLPMRISIALRSPIRWKSREVRVVVDPLVTEDHCEAAGADLDRRDHGEKVHRLIAAPQKIRQIIINVFGTKIKRSSPSKAANSSLFQSIADSPQDAHPGREVKTSEVGIFVQDRTVNHAVARAPDDKPLSAIRSR